MLQSGYSSRQAQVAVFLLSAFFHEVCTLYLHGINLHSSEYTKYHIFELRRKIIYEDMIDHHSYTQRKQL